MSSISDRNLLFGILALQMEFIERSALLEAMRVWTTNHDQQIGSVLVECGALAKSIRPLMEQLVDAHIRQHSGDVLQSLAVLSSDCEVGYELRKLNDRELTQSIDALSGAFEVGVRFDGVSTDRTLDYDTQEITQGKNFELESMHSGGKNMRYRILRPHAQGGLGRVYVALDQELNREVAFKEIRQDRVSSQEARDRFKLEAEITGGLEHPGIVPVYGLGHFDDGRPFYAMRFIRGESLLVGIRRFHQQSERGASLAQSTLDYASSLEFRNLIKRLVDVCNAIQYAHDRGVLHRDLKPDNVMLGKYGETLVVDWGLARARKELFKSPSAVSREVPLQPTSGSEFGATQQGQAMGTYGYMSPEQATGQLEILGPTSDVYSLGATLYAILTGEPPLRKLGAAELIARLQSGEIPPPRSIQPNAPRALELVCQKAMATLPADRYPSVKALTTDLDAWLADQPVSVHREPWLVRARRLIKRHPAIASASMACFVIGLISASYLAYLNGLHARELHSKNESLASQNQLITEQKVTLEKSNTDLVVAKNQAQAAEKESLQQKEIAEVNLEYARLGNDILGSVFDQLDPNVQYETIGDLRQAITKNLNRAAKSLEGSAIGDPLTVAAMQTRLGSSLIALGDAENAVTILEKARQTQTDQLGAKHHETLASGNKLALALRRTGKLDQAITLHEEVFEQARDTLGEKDEGTLVYLNDLAVAYREAGKFDRATKCFEESLEQTTKKYGPEHSKTLTAMHNLATAYESLGRSNQALQMLSSAFELMKQTFGPEALETLSCMNNLAHVMQTLGNKEAIPLLEKLLEIRQDSLGRSHPMTLRATNNLAEAYRKDGRLAESLKLHESNLPQLRLALGPDHLETLDSMTNLAEAYRSNNQIELALPLMEQSREKLSENFGAFHPRTFAITNNLATAYLTNGKTDQGLALLEQTFEQARVQFGENHPTTLVLMNNVAMANQKSGKLNRAIELFEENLRLKKGVLGEDHPSLLSSQLNLGLAYCAADDKEHAVNTLRDAVARIRPRYPEGDPRFLAVLSQVGSGLLDCHQFKDAELYLRECYDGRTKITTTDLSTYAAGNFLARALLGQKKFEEAETLLVSILAGLEKLEQDSPTIAKHELKKSMTQLVELYNATDEPAKAVPLSTRLEQLR